MNFFLTLNKHGNVSFSPFAEQDKLDCGVTCFINRPLSLINILEIQKRLNKRETCIFRYKWSRRRDVKTEILAMLKKFNWGSPDFIWQEVNLPAGQAVGRPGVGKERDNEVSQTFNRLVLGRQLSISDLRGLAQVLKTKEEEVVRLAHLNVERGRAQWAPAVMPCTGGWRCQRCGETDVEEWPSRYGAAATCRSCESIGSCTSLDVLYRDQRSLMGEPFEVLFQPHWTLTVAQRIASEQVLEFVQESHEKRALLWAACGAGKTEVCFPSAAWLLKQGKSVLFAAPRQDVIHDVVPRIKRDFPNYPVQVLTGLTPVKFQSGRMVLATTHQVLRFWRAFDVIFLDEMDAFPYRGNRALEWGLQQALRPDGKMLYLTATPSPEGLKAVQQGEISLIRLPARHHRKALPIPTWLRARNSLEPKGNACTGELVSLIETLRVQGPVLIFVPKISWINPWVKSFQRQFPDWQVDGCYSADPGRSVKTERLRQGLFDIFVSTTILERGITLSKIQVVVLAADHPVFDERALVQMAGRVGRTRENPGGRAVFISQLMTTAIRTAIDWIKEQNRIAREQGLIDD